MLGTGWDAAMAPTGQVDTFLALALPRDIGPVVPRHPETSVARTAWH